MKVGDDKPNYKDLVKATDLSPVEISVDDGAVKYDQPGVYRIIFTATDKYKNKATKDATVEILKKDDPRPAAAAPARNNRAAASPKPVANAPAASGPTVVNGIIIVNKKHGLPAGYAPGVNPTAHAAVMQMIGEMQAQGLSICIY